MKNLVFLTGAGISKASGIPTFRDSKDGLWHNFNIEDVSSIEGWKKNPQLVMDFYNARRRDMTKVEPNEAHYMVAELEHEYNVTIITQNVDDLHERAGSTHILHMHGELNRVREVIPDHKRFDILPRVYTWEGDLTLEDKSPNGYPLRPDVVWFNENVKYYEECLHAVENADILCVVGTSLQVYPASTFMLKAKPECKIFYIDPNAITNASTPLVNYNVELINKNAIDGLKEMIERLHD